jgi:hypothetical protein
MKGRSTLATTLLLLMCAGCSDEDAQKQGIGAAEEADLSVQAQEGNAEAAKKLEQIHRMRSATPGNEGDYSPDIRDGWRWSAEEVAALITRAHAGDMAAADRLLQYYAVHENRPKMDYWEDWLFKRGHPGAIRNRAFRLYAASEKRPSGDPKKLAELKETERLERSVTADGIENPFLERIRSEIAALEGSR